MAAIHRRDMRRVANRPRQRPPNPSRSRHRNGGLGSGDRNPRGSGGWIVFALFAYRLTREIFERLTRIVLFLPCVGGVTCARLMDPTYDHPTVGSLLYRSGLTVGVRGGCFTRSLDRRRRLVHFAGRWPGRVAGSRWVRWCWRHRSLAFSTSQRTDGCIVRHMYRENSFQRSTPRCVRMIVSDSRFYGYGAEVVEADSFLLQHGVRFTDRPWHTVCIRRNTMAKCRHPG